MGLGRVLAPRFQPCTLSVGGAAPSAARRAGFLFAQFTGGAGRWPSYGVIADRWPQPRQADGSRTCARSEISAVHFIRWRGERRAPRRFSFCTIPGGAGRWPSYGVIADRWPQPRQADGSRTCARSEISAVHFIRWRGGAERRARSFFLPIGRWPLASYGVTPTAGRSRGKLMGLGRVLAPRFQPRALYPLAGRRRRAPRRISFCAIGRWPRPSYGVIVDRWPQPRQADGSRTCARSEISAVHFIRWRAAPSAARRPDFFLHNSRRVAAELRGDVDRWRSPAS